MPEVTKRLRTPLYQRVGENLYQLYLETVSDQVVMTDEAGGTVQERIESIENRLDENTTTYVVDDIDAMEAIEDPIPGDGCWVKDASADETVESGAAKYIYQDETNGWVKVSEAESMDLVVSWSDVQDKPEVLDELGKDADGNLTLDGEPITAVVNPWVVTAASIDEMPEDLEDGGLMVIDSDA